MVSNSMRFVFFLIFFFFFTWRERRLEEVSRCGSRIGMFATSECEDGG